MTLLTGKSGSRAKRARMRNAPVAPVRAAQRERLAREAHLTRQHRRRTGAFLREWRRIPGRILWRLASELGVSERAVRSWRALQKRLERERVVVHARDVMWSQDATHLGRDEHGKVEALAVKDVATTRAIEHSIGGAARAEDVLALLVRAKLVRGTLPLVLAMDNGPANRNALVCSYLAAERVIVLWNVPHTPEHNPWIESQHGELKRELDASGALWRGVADPSRGPRTLAEARGQEQDRASRGVRRARRARPERARAALTRRTDRGTA